jgi:hypothetical protein
MAETPARTRTFVRGSTVLDYWLAHAEGFTVQPLGARVERVVAAVPVGRADVLIVRSRRMRRRMSIPAASIAAVEPSSGHLLLDVGETPHRGSSTRLALTGWRSARAGTGSAVAWLGPRVARTRASSARRARAAAARTSHGAAWLAPRVGRGAKAGGLAFARYVLAGTLLAAQGAVWAGRGLQRGAAGAATRARAHLR